MNRKKWLLSSSITFLIAFLLINVFRYYAENYSFDLERIIWLKKKDWQNTKKLSNYDYVVIGSSKTLAVNPQQIYNTTKMNGINFSVGGATILYHYYTIKNLIENNKNEKLPFFYINLIPYQLSEKSMLNNYLFNRKFIKFYSKKEDALEINKYINDFYSDYKAITNINYQMYSYYTLLKNIYIDLKYYYNFNSSASKLLNLELEKSNGFYLFAEPIFSHKVNNQNGSFHNHNTQLNDELPDVSYIYFNKLITLLERNNLKYKFFFSPYNERQKEFEQLNFANSLKLFKNINSKNIQNKVLLLKRKCFVDPQHLNFNCSKTYNDWFINKVLKKTNSADINKYNEYTLKL